MPKLKATYQDEAEIPAEFRSLFTKRGDVFELDVEGAKTDGDFARYSEALRKRFDDSLDKIRNVSSGVSREDLHAAFAEAMAPFTSQLESMMGKGGGQGGSHGGGGTGGKGGGQGGDDPLLHDLRRQLQATTQERDEWKGKAETAEEKAKRTLLRERLAREASAAGVPGERLDVLVNLVEPDFELASDGSLVTKLDAPSKVGPNVKPSEYFAKRKTDPSLAYFWPPSQGGGSEGSGGATGGAGSNPFSRENWNLTKQGQLIREDRAKAEQLAKQAGTRIGGPMPAGKEAGGMARQAVGSSQRQPG